MRFALPCQSKEPPCKTEVGNWRQCAVKGCAIDIVYCAAHGGESRAELEMATHMAEKHGS